MANRAISIPQFWPCAVQNGESAQNILPSAFLADQTTVQQGFSYEYATLGCLFDPLLSVQYYALASQNGEVEADMGELANSSLHAMSL